MINLIIKDGSKVSIIEENKKDNKRRLATVMAVGAIYILFRTAARHELEIANLKKVIEEMKSKGE